MKLTRTVLVLVQVFVLSVVCAEDLGLRAQHEKKLWVTYRSFNKEGGAGV